MQQPFNSAYFNRLFVQFGVNNTTDISYYYPTHIIPYRMYYIGLGMINNISAVTFASAHFTRIKLLRHCLSIPNVLHYLPN